MTIPNKQEISKKLYNQLKESGWSNLLKAYLLSDDFNTIISSLQERVDNNKRFTPPLKDVFKAFTECPIDNLKVIIVGEAPYQQFGVADGISFSTSQYTMFPFELRCIFNEINKSLFDDKEDILTWDRNLSRWSNQGVLLLNTSLTRDIETPNVHYKIWYDFIAYLIDMLNVNDKYIWVFLGDKAKEYASLVNDDHIKLFTSYPHASSGKQKPYWDSNDIFNKINSFLEHKKIIW